MDVRIELYMVCGLPTNDAIIFAECVLEFLKPTAVVYNEIYVLANVLEKHDCTVRIVSEALSHAQCVPCFPCLLNGKRKRPSTYLQDKLAFDCLLGFSARLRRLLI